MPQPLQTIVIGIGNPDRGDDAAGRAVARMLRPIAAEAGVEIVEQDGEATALLSLLQGRSRAYLVDACRSGAACGTVRRFDAAASALPSDVFALSTHGLGLAEAVELARALGQLPSECVVYAIEGDLFETDAPLSASVKAAIVDVSRRLFREISPESVY